MISTGSCHNALCGTAGQLEQLASPVLAKIKPTLIALKLCIERQKGFGRRTLVLKGEPMQAESCVPHYVEMQATVAPLM